MSSIMLFYKKNLTFFNSLKCQFYRLCVPFHCSNSVQISSFFQYIFFHIWTEYEDLLHKFPYSVQILETMTQKKLRIQTLFRQFFLFESIKYIIQYNIFSQFIAKFCHFDCDNKLFMLLTYRLMFFLPEVVPRNIIYTRNS